MFDPKKHKKIAENLIVELGIGTEGDSLRVLNRISGLTKLARERGLTEGESASLHFLRHKEVQILLRDPLIKKKYNGSKGKVSRGLMGRIRRSTEKPRRPK